MTILAIDAGTTGVTVLIVRADGTVAARGYREFPQHFPRPGWVEHDLDEIWAATLAATGEALAGAPAPPRAIGLTNQRETIGLWDRRSLAPAGPAIVWQDRRSVDVCETLREAGAEPRVAELTGLRLDPYFSATKLRWLAEHDPRRWAGARAGHTVLGTIDTYLIARLSGGRAHVTDASNASRTLLFDLDTGDWSDELCALFDVPRAALAQVVDSSGVVAHCDPDAYHGLRLPIAGIAGDQQAALFGQACLRPGEAKATYGTGSFVLVNTGDRPRRSTHGLLSTVAWRLAGQPLTYALEGSVFVTGAAVQWLRDGLRLIDTAADVEALAASVPDSGGVVFVPALTGLGAPHWDPRARGAVLGLSRGSTEAHLARATLDAIAFQIRDVMEAIAADTGTAVGPLAVDGGAAANDLLCQIQADQLGVAVRRPHDTEATALGSAFLAGLAVGVWTDLGQIADARTRGHTFTPGARDEAGYRRWHQAVTLARQWGDQ